MGMVVVGCSKDEVDKGNDNDIPENIFFGLDKESITISPYGGSVDVVVYSNHKWEISGVSDWCTPSVKKGGANEDGQIVSFSADMTYDDREATFWFRCADEKIKFVVSQKLKAVIIPDANNSFNIPAEGGIAVISYQTSVDCEVIVPDEAQDWITVAPVTRGLVRENINLDIAENTTYDSRSAVIKVVAKDNAELVVEYTINQEQNDAILVDENNTFTVPCAGGEVVINYRTNVDCDVIIPEEAKDWITIVPATRGLVSENINLDIAENTTFSARTAVIKVVAKDNAELAVEYTISQEQNDAILADDNNVFTVPGPGGEVVIKYQTNVDCEVVIPEEAQDWITITPSTRGLVTYNTTLNIAANYSGELRSSVIKVISQEDSELFAEYTITQNMMYYLCYTSSDGKLVEPYSSSAFDATILSNTYKDGVGIIEFNAPITTIGDSAFYWCSSLTSVTIPDSVTTIGDYAFSGCSSLQEFKGKFASEDGRCLIIDGTLNYFAPAGLTEYTIPDSVTTIGDEAFYGCSSLTSVTIPDSVTTIGDSAFRGCSSLTSVTIPEGVTTIGEEAFYNCSSLTSVTIPDSVTTIGGWAFYDCSSLTSVTIPDSVTTIGDSAFAGCSSLTSVYIADLSAWCRIGFEDYSANPLYYAGGDLYFNNELVTDLVIPSDVTEIKNYAFDGCSSLTSVTIPDSVTTIGEGAFYGCTGELMVNCNIPSASSYLDGAFYSSNFSSVTIGDSVTTVGSYAFYDCSSLTSVTIGDSVTSIGDYVFYDCSSLTSVYCKTTTPPAGGASMFYNNVSDRKIYVPMELIEAYKSASGWSQYADAILGYDFENGEIEGFMMEYISTDGMKVTPYNLDAFDAQLIGNYCINGKWYLYFDCEITKIGVKAFYNCKNLENITIPDSVTTIGDYAFNNCNSLTSITIPDSVTTIGDNAFYNCRSLTSVTIPDSVTTIGKYAFHGCTGELLINCNIPSASSYEYGEFYGSKFTSVTIGDSVTSIGGYAFYDCSRLKSVTIGDSVTTIGNYAFDSCSSLISITIPDNVTTIGDGAFRVCSSLTSVTIGDSVTTIGYDAFAACISLTSVTIGDSVTTIGKYAFFNCSRLKSVTIGDSVTTIGNHAFEDCSSLTSVTIPDSVTSIGDEAFIHCSSLTSVYCKATTPPAGGYEMFHFNAGNSKIYVPMQSVEAYKSAPYWSEYADSIVGYDF